MRAPAVLDGGRTAAADGLLIVAGADSSGMRKQAQPDIANTATANDHRPRFFMSARSRVFAGKRAAPVFLQDAAGGPGSCRPWRSQVGAWFRSHWPAPA